MRSSTLIVWLLAAACIAIDLAMIGELQIRRNEWPGVGGIIGFGFAFSQTCLIAAWMTWGSWNVLLRTVISLCGVWGLSYLMSYSEVGTLSAAGIWFGGLLIYFVGAIVPFVLLRLSGYRIQRLIDEHDRDGVAVRLISYKYTIWDLLSILTTTGVILGVLRFAELPTWRETLEGAVIFAILAATASAMYVSAFLVRQAWMAIVIVMTLCPSAGYLLTITPGADRFAAELMLMTGWHGAITIVAVGLLRSGGYRLVRGRRIEPTTATELLAAPESVSVDQAGEP